MQPTIAMMLAMDRNKLIGSAGGLPWSIPGELAYFKSVTMGKPVIMGRKTYESMGRPLPGRTNIVVTRNSDWAADGVTIADTLKQALVVAYDVAQQPATAAEEVMVIGGAGLCREAMPLTQRFYLTLVDHAFEGDTWLDSFNWDDWQEVSRDTRDPATTGGLDVAYLTLLRRRKSGWY
ncbi:MAG: dihydrofolate reductase [Granulosicoccus sp.]